MTASTSLYDLQDLRCYELTRNTGYTDLYTWSRILQGVFESTWRVYLEQGVFESTWLRA